MVQGFDFVEDKCVYQLRGSFCTAQCKSPLLHTFALLGSKEHMCEENQN